jgi:hypothetical protein
MMLYGGEGVLNGIIVLEIADLMCLMILPSSIVMTAGARRREAAEESFLKSWIEFWTLTRVMAVSIIIGATALLSVIILGPIHSTFDNDVSDGARTAAIMGGNDTELVSAFNKDDAGDDRGQVDSVADLLKSQLIKDGFIVTNVKCDPKTADAGDKVSCSVDGRIPVPFAPDIQISSSASALSEVNASHKTSASTS